MKRSIKKYAAVAWLAVAPLAFCSPAWSEAYPERPLRIVHGGGHGGNADLISRAVATELSERLGQNVIVEAKPGAGQNIAMAAVAKAEPDGYTLALLNAGISIQMALNPNLQYNLRDDFVPLSMLSSFPDVIVVSADSPYKTMGELIEAARQQPGKLNFGAMLQTTRHLTGELIASSVPIKWAHVPYTDSAGPLTDLVGGRLDVVFDSLTALMSHIKSGKVRALAVTSGDRWPTLPDVPPLSETLPGIAVTSWTGLAVPAGTPPEVRERLERELAAIVVTDSFAEQVRRYGSEPYSMGAADMKKYIDEEIDRWKGVAEGAQLVLK